MSRHHAPKEGLQSAHHTKLRTRRDAAGPEGSDHGNDRGRTMAGAWYPRAGEMARGLVTRVPVCSNIVTEGWTSPPLTFRRRLLMEMVDLTEDESVAIRDRIAVLSIEHRDLDEVIARLSEDPVQDELQLKRLKRRKLLLKDHITVLERQLVPDARA